MKTILVFCLFMSLSCFSQSFEPSLLNSFQAQLDDNRYWPPDSMGAAGPNHIVTMTNSMLRVQNKFGTVLQTKSNFELWEMFPGVEAIDPRIIFDPLSARWVISSSTYNKQLLMAISDTDNPLDGWTCHSFDTGLNDPDFPTLGMNKNWIAIAANMYQNGIFIGIKLWLINKPLALQQDIKYTVIEPGIIGGFAISPCLTFDPNEERLFIIDNSLTDDDNNNFVRLSQVTGTPVLPVWSYPVNNEIMVPNKYNFTQANAIQHGDSRKILTNDFRICNAVFRNGSIWTCNSGGLPYDSSPNRTSVFWYQIDPESAGIVQSGVVDSGPGKSNYYPSIAVNANNDVCLGFSRSDSLIYAEAAYSIHLANDQPGLCRSIRTLKTGEDSYYKNSGNGNRWGDYSATCIDPQDDSFWTIQEYAALSVGSGTFDDRWAIWAGRLNSCFSDLDRNGIIDTSDLSILLSHYGLQTDYSNGDLNNDEWVDLVDLSILLQHYGDNCATN